MAAVSRSYDCSEPMERTRGIAEAVSAVRRGELIVLPTDTVYGIGADAFTPTAVNALLEAKGRGRDMPSPVLVGSVRAAQALVEDFGTYGQDLVDEFWPGALTLVCRANSTLAWDLGDSKGTVAVRMPLHQLALELLKETGPLAVSSANRSGAPPARTAAEAEAQLGESVEVYLDDGPSGEADPSSIVDLTGAVPRLLRAAATERGARPRPRTSSPARRRWRPRRASGGARRARPAVRPRPSPRDPLRARPRR
jgi:L-threonylcarbamoyladenylate synthase